MDRRLIILIAFTGYVAVALYLFVFSESGAINHARVKARTAVMEEEIQRLTEDNRRLTRDIERLTHDAAYIRSLAKVYGFREHAKEKVVVFLEDRIVSNKALIAGDERMLKAEGRTSYFVLIVFIVLTVILYAVIRIALAGRKKQP